MFQSFSFILANQNGKSGGGSEFIIMMILLFVMMYFVLFRPQQKRAKLLRNQLAAAKPGDSVITLGGLHGKISRILDTTMMIKFAENIKIEVDKASIGTVISKADAKAAEKAKQEASEQEDDDQEVIEEAEVIQENEMEKKKD